MTFFSPSRVEAGNGTRLIQDGMCDGACFWKKCLPCQPSGWRFIVNGPAPQMRDEHLGDVAVVRDRSPFVMPSSGQKGLSRLLRRSSRRPFRSTAGNGVRSLRTSEAFLSSRSPR